MSKRIKQELIAPCGMNCGICVAYLRDKGKCPGCRSRDKKCSIRRCEKFLEKKFRYCYECDGFPCARVKRLDKRYRTKYEMSMIENLEYIIENSVSKFIEREITRWKCPKCGGVICVHNRKCYNCGTQGIPTTGRIGRFAKILEKETNREILEKIMLEADKYESFNYAKKAAWWRGATLRLEKEVGKETAIKIMESCGRKCCGGTYRKHAEKYWMESKSVEDVLDKLNNYVWHGQVVGIGGGRLKLKDERTIIGGYDHCYCGQVKQTKEPFPTDIYCRCSAGWFKQFFKSALSRAVEVELVQSIITGAKTCEFIIHI